MLGEIAKHIAHLASRTREIIPEIIEVAALVPPKYEVHPPPSAVVLCVKCMIENNT